MIIKVYKKYAPGGNMRRNVYANRFMGYKHALRDHKINFAESLLIIGKLDEEAGTQASGQVLKMGALRPDGVFSANDTAAGHCMIKLKEAGLLIPATLLLPDSKDTITKTIGPNLTAINYPEYETGKAAACQIYHQNDV